MYLTKKLFVLSLIFLLAGAVLLTNDFRPVSAQKAPVVPNQLSPNAARQILALIEEKESRTAAQKKIDSQLIYASKKAARSALTEDVPSLEANVSVGADDLVPVDIRATVSRELLDSITEAGGKVVFFSKQLKTINARVPLDALEKLASLDEVQFIYPADRARTHSFPDARGTPTSTSTILSKQIFGSTLSSALGSDFSARADRVRAQIANALSLRPVPASPMPTGSVTSEGDITHKAALGRSSFAATGAGVKIGVLSDGVSNLANSQASGDLPAVTVLPGQTGSGDEGTAMLEIIHDLAPGAQLFFATAFTSQASFAQNILDLRTAGCDIIVDDVLYFREAVFQDDNVAQSVNTVTASGALYLSSSGNEGNKTDNTSGVWEGDFVDGGTLTVGATTLPGQVHDFGGGVTNNQLLAGNGGAPIGLFWSDPLGGSGNDYDLYILDAGLTTVVSAATNVQDGNDDPVELSTISPAAGRRFVILQKTGAAARALHLDTFRGRLNFNTPGQTHGHSSAADAYSVAATPAHDPFGAPPNPVGPFPNPHNSTNLTELFSSDGPRRVFFNANGTPITPGNFLFATNGGTLRVKPDITAADGVVNTGPGGFPSPFFGTSAAAPHAAAIAGLVKSAVPGITPAQIRTALTSTAIDIEAPGVDRDSGAGIIMAFEALVAAGATPQPLINSAGSTITAESCSPADNSLSPGETVTVDFGLKNSGAAPTTNLVATLQATGGVTSPSGPQNYGVIPADNTTVVSRAFTFTVDPATPCGGSVTATFDLQDGVNSLGTVTFTLQVGTPTGTLTTVYSSGNVAVPIPDVSSVEVPINVADVGTVADINVRVRLNHTFDGDLVIALVAPDGTVVNLANNRGGAGQNYGTGSNDCSGTPTTFDDEAALTIASGTAPFAGSFRPDSTLSGLDGKAVNGTWKLRVTDTAALDVGTIGCVSLQITRQLYACCGVVGTPIIQAGDTTLINESCPPTNGAIDPGERVTVNLELTNAGTGPTSDLVATLVQGGGVQAPGDPQSFGALAAGATGTRDFSFTATGSCGTTLTATWQLSDGPNDLGTVSKTFTLGTAVDTVQTFSNPAPILIPGTGTSGPAEPYPSTINVAGVVGTVSKVTVTLKNMNHTFPDDIDVLLVGPGGQKLLLMSDAGGSADLVNNTYTFDDAAASTLADGALSASGTYKPSNFGTGDTFPAPAPVGPYPDPQLLSVFNGVNPNGTWSLYVFDDVGGDVGNINLGWEINITTTAFVCTVPCGVVRLVITSELERVNATLVKATFRVQNTGTAQADNVQLTTARLGATNGGPFPFIGSIPANNQSPPFDVFFTNSTPGATSTLTLGGTFTGGTFSSTKRVTIP